MPCNGAMDQHTHFSSTAIELSSPSPARLGYQLSAEDVPENSAATIISRIEDILEAIVDALQENRRLIIPLRSRTTGIDIAVTYPTTSSGGARRFATLLQILYHCHEALLSGIVVTKRHIYYQNPILFESQAYVDRLVDDVAYTFGVNRDSLNIVAASKGLVAGNQCSGGTGNHTDNVEGIAIPQSLVNINLRRTRWILVIEKEATFRSLTAQRYFESSAAGPGLLVTAKGYPDLTTRRFLYMIHSQYPYIPIYALVDFDPDGISIMRNYKLGSRSLQHETNVTVPGLVWLGVKSSDVFDSNIRQGSIFVPVSQLSAESHISQSASSVPSTPSSSSYQRPMVLESDVTAPGRLVQADYKTTLLSSNDRSKATNLLKNLENQNILEAEELDLARELQFMLMLNIKFEIQAVCEEGNMTGWLDNRLSLVFNSIGIC